MLSSMSKELEVLSFADVCVKGSLQQDKERLESWRKDREVLYSALERKEKLEKAFELIKNKKVDVWYEIMLSVAYDDYLDQKTDLSEELTEEEYDSLKEIFG